jgi:hypothetical protein
LNEYAIQVAPGEYNAFIKSPEYRRQKIADRISYVWDRLIDLFVEHVLAGTSVALLGHEPNAALAERGLRLMALENRVYRRLLASSLGEVLNKAREQKVDRLVRRMLPATGTRSRRVAYILLVLSYPKGVELKNGYADYRTTRANMLQFYCLDLFDQCDDIDFVVGIAGDAAEEVSGRAGGSEDLVTIERPDWTEELRSQLEEARKLLDIKPFVHAKARHATTTEYPQTENFPLTRQQRRAEERTKRKGQRSRKDGTPH